MRSRHGSTPPMKRREFLWLSATASAAAMMPARTQRSRRISTWQSAPKPMARPCPLSANALVGMKPTLGLMTKLFLDSWVLDAELFQVSLVLSCVVVVPLQFGKELRHLLLVQFD